MRALVISLRVLALAFVATAVLHVVLGLGADELLGSPVTDAMKSEPTFDSQNRFYGATFGALGVVLWIATSDLARFRPMVPAVLAVLFVAGLGRALAWVIHGAPAGAIIVIVVADLLLPPLFVLWLNRVLPS